MNAIADAARKRTFDIRSEWILEARGEELTAIVLDPDTLAEWGRNVFMQTDILDRGDAQGLGMSVRVHTKGWLPHSFVFFATITSLVPHRFMRLDVSGDFTGFGELTVVPLPAAGGGPEMVRADVHWNADCHHPFIGPLTHLVPRLFEWNHLWALARMRERMQAEVHRRRAGLSRDALPVPSFPHTMPLLRRYFGRRRTLS